MKFYWSLLFILAFSCAAMSQDICDCPSQTKVGKGTFYFSWGYNRDWFSKSDIHFQNKGEYDTNLKRYVSYDFTVYNVKAKDRAHLKDIFRTDLTIPQYNYRIGYFFNNKKDIGIELNFDHVKYIMSDWQTLRVKGTIDDQYIDQDTLISPDNFLHFEHSDGANFLFLNIVKRQRLYVSGNKKHWVSMVGKIGAGIVVPRTDVLLFGERINNCFHIAGYGGGIEGGFRYDAFKHVFLEYTIKAAYTNYVNVLVLGQGKANHYFFTGENILTLGFQFPW